MERSKQTATAFVAHDFKDSDKDVVVAFKELFAALGLRIETGEIPEASSVVDKVRDRITESDLFMGIFTRRDKVEGRNEWTTSAWLRNEMGIAFSLGMPLVLLAEKGVNFEGITSHLDRIVFERESLHLAFTKVVYCLRRFLWDGPKE